MSDDSPESDAPDYESLEAAAAWFALLSSEDATAADHRRWRDWLNASAAHRAAWAYVERVGARFASLGGDDERTAAAAALASARRRTVSRRRALKGLALLLAGGPLAGAAWRYTSLPSLARSAWTDYSTGVGEIRRVVLDDGSRVWLDTASALDVERTGAERRLRLVAGEVLVETSAAAGQPELVVVTDRGRLRPLGTRFSVRRGDDADHLTVVDGSVELRTAGTNQRRIIDAGQRTRFTRDRIETPETADANHLAWRHRQLIANETPLGELVEELARYRYGHVAVDPAVADVPVMGTYPLDDTDRALTMLGDALPVRIERPLPWWVTIKPAR